MNITQNGVGTKEFHWLVGLLEGEGCFGIHVLKAVPHIKLNMTDLDIVEKAYKLLGATAKLVCFDRSKQNPKWKKIYNFAISGRKAVGWMMMLYLYMGERRKQRIKEILEQWRNHPARKVRKIGVPRKIEGENNTEYARLWYAARQADRGRIIVPRVQTAVA